MAPAAPPALPERQRLSLDLAPAVSLALDNISAVTGVPKSQVVLGALLDALPGIMERTGQLWKLHAAAEAAVNEALAKGKGGKR
jgi:hypothetical protein